MSLKKKKKSFEKTIFKTLKPSKSTCLKGQIFLKINIILNSVLLISFTW